MALPEQLVSDKGDKFCKKNANAIINMATMSSAGKQKDVLCWRMYNEEFRESDYDYLTKVGDYEYPAKVRWIGIVRPSLNLLQSQKKRRPFIHTVFAVDKRSLEKKQEKIIQKYITELDKRIREKYNTILMQQRQVDQKMQEIQQMLALEPENEQQQQQLQQLQALQPQIEKQFTTINDELKREMVLTTRDITEIEKYNKYDLKDIVEEIDQKGLYYLRTKLEILEESLKVFKDKLVTGKGCYFVDWNPGDPLPTYEMLDSVKVYYPSEGNNRWIQRGQWVALEENISYAQAIDDHGKEMDYTQREIINRYSKNPADNSYVRSVPGNGAIFDDTAPYAGSQQTGGTIKRWRIFWISPRKVKIKLSPNKYSKGKYFRHIVDEEDLAKEPIQEKKGEKIDERFINDVYQTTVLAGKVYLKMGKKPLQLRSEDNPSHVELPVVGRTYNNRYERPYSLVWATKDAQIMYNIVNYHEELLLALSGVKGFIMDKSQKPDSMSMKEWMYQRKLGVGWIETIKKGVRNAASFNQFQSYDDTVSPAIQYLKLIKDGYIEMVANITGINRQRLGDVVPSDQVRTYEMSTEHSNLVTEILFHEQDEVDRMALSRLINICNKNLWADGKLLPLSAPDLSTTVLSIPAGVTKNVDIEVLVADNDREDLNMKEVKQLIVKEYDKGSVNLADFVQLYNTDSLTQLEKKIEYFVEKAQEIAVERESASAEAEHQSKVDLLKLQKEYDKAIKDQENELKAYSTKIEEARLKLETEQMAWERDFKERELQLKDKQAMLEIGTERELEGAYLSEQHRASVVDEKLNLMQLKIETILNASQLEKDHKRDMKKLEVDKKKAETTSRAKEHISDR